MSRRVREDILERLFQENDFEALGVPSCPKTLLAILLPLAFLKA